MGAIGYVGQSLCYMSALQYASAGLVALLLYLYPMLVTILSVLILKDKLTKWNGLALLLATAGCSPDCQSARWAVDGSFTSHHRCYCLCRVYHCWHRGHGAGFGSAIICSDLYQRAQLWSV